MNEKTNMLSCVIFQARLPELIGSGANISDHSHLRTCINCRCLLNDLESIADAARQLLSNEDPSVHVWKEIQSVIQAEEIH
jgi:hypothetical protein